MENINKYISELVQNYVPNKYTLTAELLYKYFRELPIYYDVNQYHYKSASFTMYRHKGHILILPEFRPAIVIPFTQLKSVLIPHVVKPFLKPHLNNQISIFDFIPDIN